MSDLKYPDAWFKIADKILKEGNLILVIGGVDTGKTTLITFLANFLYECGKKVAIVDADVGQSDIGPPCTIGLGILNKKLKDMGEAEVKGMYFVGSISPEGHLLEMVVGTKKMVDKARNYADIVLVDTTGLVSGYTGRILKRNKIELINPNFLISLQRNKELEHIILPFEKNKNLKIYKLPVDENVRIKTKEERKLKRENEIIRYFNNSLILEFSYKDFIIEDKYFKSGREIKGGDLKFLSDNLRRHIFYAELNFDTLFIVSDGEEVGENLFRIKNHFKVEKVLNVGMNYFKDKLVGLTSNDYELKGLGVIKDINFYKKTLCLVTTLKEIQKIWRIKFSNLLVDIERQINAK
jgi:polynucleotide 5'-hydroxyl-kinase GRC3/NOL9